MVLWTQNVQESSTVFLPFLYRKSLSQDCFFHLLRNMWRKHQSGVNPRTLCSGEHVQEEPSAVGILSFRKKGREIWEQDVHLECSPSRPHKMWLMVQKALPCASSATPPKKTEQTKRIAMRQKHRETS